jgi:hypothetical protein
MGWWWEVAEGEKLRAERDAGRAWCGSRRAEIVFPELQDHTRHADTPRCAFATEKLGGHACLALTVLLEAQHERRRSSCLIGPDPETWLGSVIDITPACKPGMPSREGLGGFRRRNCPCLLLKFPFPLCWNLLRWRLHPFAVFGKGHQHEEAQVTRAKLATLACFGS